MIELSLNKCPIHDEYSIGLGSCILTANKCCRDAGGTRITEWYMTDENIHGMIFELECAMDNQ